MELNAWSVLSGKRGHWMVCVAHDGFGWGSVLVEAPGEGHVRSMHGLMLTQLLITACRKQFELCVARTDQSSNHPQYLPIAAP